MHFLKPMLPTNNVFLQNKLFKKCFEIHHATLCETNHGFNVIANPNPNIMHKNNVFTH